MRIASIALRRIESNEYQLVLRSGISVERVVADISCLKKILFAEERAVATSDQAPRLARGLILVTGTKREESLGAGEFRSARHYAPAVSFKVS